VNVDVTERGATTRVTQEFENSTGRPLEATYLFPLPTGATVNEFALWMNGKREVGKVLERQEARRIYEGIVRRMRDPGLIEYVNADLFEARVFPVPANGRQKIELIYSHLVDYDSGVHRYRYPMKTDQRAATTLQDFTFTINIKNKLPIRNVYSPTHHLAIKKSGETAAASFEKNSFSLADDLLLYWSVDDKDVGVTVLSYKEGDEPGYFLLLASPKDGFRDKEIIGKRVSFVVDISGSMSGPKMDATKRALDYCLSQLGDDDLFNVIAFGGYVDAFSGPMVSASKANIQKARTFVKNLDPAGGTNIDEALQAAFKGATGSPKIPHIIVFLTDGIPTAGETDINVIMKRATDANGEKARIFVFGVGDDVNTILLDKLASENRGTATYLKGDASIETEIKSFYDRLSHPVLSDLQLEIEGARTFAMLPDKLPDLFKGGELALLGRYRTPGKSAVKLIGTTPQGRKTFTYDASFAENTTEHGFIPRLWAQRQVAMLLAQVREKGENPSLVSEITQLATRYGIVTPYTSYLVVEPTASDVPRPDPRHERPPMPEAQAMSSEDLGVFGPRRSMSAAKSAPTTTPSPQPSAPAEMLKKDSGDEAVAAAKEINRLRDSTNATDKKAKTSVVRALGRTFRYEAGFYVDEKAAAKDDTLSIEAYSDAFFLVLKLRPELKPALMIGERVKLNVGAGRTLIITPDGKKSVDEGTLSRFLKG
jgi:Ca-activated chloride channel family protein